MLFSSSFSTLECSGLAIVKPLGSGGVILCFMFLNISLDWHLPISSSTHYRICLSLWGHSLSNWYRWYQCLWWPPMLWCLFGFAGGSRTCRLQVPKGMVVECLQKPYLLTWIVGLRWVAEVHGVCPRAQGLRPRDWTKQLRDKPLTSL